MMIIIFVFYHDWIAMFLLENKRITSNKGHLTFKNTLTILFAVFNDQ